MVFKERLTDYKLCIAILFFKLCYLNRVFRKFSLAMNHVWHICQSQANDTICCTITASRRRKMLQVITNRTNRVTAIGSNPKMHN